MIVYIKVLNIFKNNLPFLTNHQLNQLARLKKHYKKWNEKINVVSRKDIDNLDLKHIIHSLSILAVFKYQVLFRSIFFLLILNLFSPSIITYIFQLLLIIFNILVFLISKRENSEEFRDCEKKIGSTESLYNSRL